MVGLFSSRAPLQQQSPQKERQGLNRVSTCSPSLEMGGGRDLAGILHLFSGHPLERDHLLLTDRHRREFADQSGSGAARRQDCFDLRQYRLNPPTGANIHWSRLVDLPIAGLILLLRPFVGGTDAERAAVAIAPMLPCCYFSSPSR